MFYNQEEELLDNDQADTIFRDITLLALSGFISIVILLLPWLNFQIKDIEIKEILHSLIKIDIKKNRIEIYKKHLKKISESIKTNKLYSDKINEKVYLNNL